MARKKSTTTPGRAVSAYPWEAWFRKAREAGRLVLHRGTDFSCLPHGFGQAARNAGARHGLRLGIHVGPAAVTIEVKETA